MKVSLLALTVGLVAYASAAPAKSAYVVHEKRETQHQQWSRRDVQLNRDAVIPLSIGLAQQNLDKGYEFLMDVSHPESPNYGKHWSMEKIAETFSASADSIAAVKEWLTDSGIAAERIGLSKSRNWIKFNATVDEAESLLRTQYGIYTNSETGKDHLACESYSMPPHIQAHVDFIKPTVHFDAYATPTRKRRGLQGRSTSERSLDVKPIQIVHPGPDLGPVPEIQYNLTNCYQYTTPECLRALYNLPNGTLALSSYGIAEYTPVAHRQDDLNLFYSTLQAQIPSGYGPIIESIDGGTIDVPEYINYNAEADLDLEYAIALVYPQNVTLYQVGDDVEGASFGNFLDAFDASYCSGDDPTYDVTYPDTSSGGYNGTKTCGTLQPAAVISTSYGYNEADLSPAYQTRQCNEYMKLGLAGTTFIYSSGDSGVAGNGGRCCASAKCAGGTLNSGGAGTFNPAFPATCPYVTTVGATQIKPNSAVTASEEACETVIYSGGGFSNVYPIPSYQSSAIASYYASHKPSYTATQYNNSQAVRGYPDVAANGANFVVGLDGSLQLVYGTSCSAPTFGAVITLINQQRIKAGKSAVGFINPTIYANPSAFNDITSGGNQGCGTAGFTAVEGWDPVTGLGTPNYEALLAAFLALP